MHHNNLLQLFHIWRFLEQYIYLYHNYARILFVVGLEHDNYKKNLELANNINKLFNDSYPGLSRGVYKKEGINVNGIYNQDVSENAMLIEVGGVDNNIEEVMNTMNAISDVISKYIGDNN